MVKGEIENKKLTAIKDTITSDDTRGGLSCRRKLDIRRENARLSREKGPVI